jgi:hypothetical protein
MSEFNYRQESDGWWWSYAIPFAQEHGPFAEKEEMLASMENVDRAREARVAFINEALEEGTTYEKVEAGRGWQDTRVEWNAIGLCARVACDRFHEGYAHPTTDLLYCTRCAGMLQVNQRIVMEKKADIDDVERRLRREYWYAQAAAAPAPEKTITHFSMSAVVPADRAPRGGVAKLAVVEADTTAKGRNKGPQKSFKKYQRMYATSPLDDGTDHGPTHPGFRDEATGNKNRKARRKAEKAARRKNR